VQQKCACGKHQFEFQYTDGYETFVCPECGREYVLYVDMEDDGELEVELTLTKEPKTA